jgi:hypothetical protein
MPRRKKGRFSKASMLGREKRGFDRREGKSFNTKKRKIGRFGIILTLGKRRGREIRQRGERKKTSTLKREKKGDLVKLQC